MTNLDQSVSTGNAQMDTILHGGFPANSINIIMGLPGTGKTIFAEQMIFHHALTHDRPILYITTLSEPVAKVLTYLQRFEFFDEEKVGTVIHYRDIGAQLAEKGIETLVPYIKDVILTLAPKIIVIDSFKALHDVADSPQQMRRVLYQLTGLLTSFETTVFLVGEYNDHHAEVLPEFAIADGIVQFLRSSLTTRDERFLRVLKLRGSAYREGLHGCNISAAGMEIYPRLITPHVPETYVASNERIVSGVPGLDEVLGGGLLSGSATILGGPTGAGKTTASMQFILSGIQQNQPGLYVNFQENPSQLGRLIQALGADYYESKAAGLELQYSSPVELQIDSVIVKLFETVRAKDIKRVVVDSIGDLAKAAGDHERLYDYLYSLLQHLAIRGVTSLLTYETVGEGFSGGKGHIALTRFSNMADNIILLGTGSEPDYHGKMRAIKTRGSRQDRRSHLLEVGDNGVTIF